MAEPLIVYLLNKILQRHAGGMVMGVPYKALEIVDYSTLGSEMVVAGDFSTTTGWTWSTTGSYAINFTVAGNQGTMTETDSSVLYGRVYQAITTKVGHRYVAMVTFKGTLSSGLAASYPNLRIGTSAGGLEVGTRATATYVEDQTITVDFIATSTTTYLTLYHRSASTDVGVSVWQTCTMKEVIGGDVTVRGTTYLGGDSYFGGWTNHVKIAKEGILSLGGTATVFDDLNFEPSSSGGPAATLPDYVTINNVIHREFTSANNQICGDGQELPHKYKLSSVLYPHVHVFLKSGESAGTTGVTFTLYWELRQSTGTTSGSVTLAATSAELGTTAGANKFSIYDATGFAGAAELGGQLSLKLARTAGDAGDVVVTTYGVHYEIDSIGSNTLTTK